MGIGLVPSYETIGIWGAMLLTLAATAAAYLTAFYIHTQTYRHPRDVMMRQRGGGEAHAAAQTGHATDAPAAAPHGEH